MTDFEELLNEAHKHSAYVVAIVTPDGLIATTRIIGGLYENPDLFWELARNDLRNTVWELRQNQVAQGGVDQPHSG